MTTATFEIKATSTPCEEIKVLRDDGDRLLIAGRGVRFDTVDLTGDRFSKNTRFFLDEYKREIPVLMNHGMDEVFGKSPIGAVVKVEEDELGLWVTATLSAAEKYLTAIRKVLPKLGWSSGALAQLVARKSAGNGVSDITSWFISEWSLTATPAAAELWGGITEVGPSEKRLRAEFAAFQLREHQAELGPLDVFLFRERLAELTPPPVLHKSVDQWWCEFQDGDFEDLARRVADAPVLKTSRRYFVASPALSDTSVRHG